MPGHSTIGWTDSDVTMGTDGDALISEETVPSTVLVRPKMEEAVVFLNSQGIGEIARQPAAARKAARGSAPNAKAQITGEDKAVKVAKAKVVKAAKAVKETKVKAMKETKGKETAAKTAKGLSAKVVKETPAKPVKVLQEKPAKEAKAEVVKQNRVKNEPTEPKIAQVKQPKVRKAPTRRLNQRVIAGQPKWSVPWTLRVDRTEARVSSDRGPPSSTDLRPRAWCGSKDELVSALPELAKCTNGVSWLQSEPPVLFLEEGNMGMMVSKVESHSLELKMTRTFYCTPADLNTPSAATLSTTEPPCNYIISQNFQPVNVKSHFNFSSRPRFIPMPRVPRTSNAQDFAARPVSLPNTNRVPSRGAEPKDLQPESENDVAFRAHHIPDYSRMSPECYEVPMSSLSFVMPRGSLSPFSEFFRHRPVGRHSSTSTSTSTSTSSPSTSTSSPSPSPFPATRHLRRCTCAMRGNIYCGVCDVKLQSEEDPHFQSKEGDLRYVPATNLLQMGASHAHAFDDEVAMPSNTFACQVTSYADLQLACDTGLRAGIVLPSSSASSPSFASSSSSWGVQPPCRCSVHQSLPCIVCSPKTGTQPSQSAMPSFSPPAPGLSRTAPHLGLKLGQGLVEKSAPVQDQSKKKLISPLMIRIPRRVVAPQTAVHQGGHVLPSSNTQVKVEDPAPTPLPFTPAPAHVPPHTQQNPSRMPKEVGTRIDQRIPSVLPSEVQVIIDAYISGTPLIVIATKDMLKARWGVSVPAECSYAYLGFFSVGEVLEERVTSPILPGSTPDRPAGQVEWRFKCIWGASGEEDADPTSSPGSPQPWWDPRPPKTSDCADLHYPRWKPLDALRVPARARARSHSDNVDKSNSRYSIARRQHPNARFGLGTSARLGDRYWSVLPDHVRGRLGTETGWDQGFGYECVPTGWWCERCGRVNYQALLRMRWCVGERCRAEVRTPVHPQGFATPLELLRNPMLVMPTTHPVDSYLAECRVRDTASTWADGMRTFVYAVREPGAEIPSTNINASMAVNPDPIVNSSTGVGVKHIFTGNMRSLQVEATELLFEIQKNVPLQRAVADPGPYFLYSVFSPVEGGGAPPTGVVAWDRVPSCVTRVKEMMLFFARGYGEDRAFEMNRLDMFAWVTSGIKKGSSPLHCGKRPLVLICLGSEAVISVVPKSGFNEPEVVQALASGSSAVGASTELLGTGVDMDTDGLIPMGMGMNSDMDMDVDAVAEDEDVFMLELGAEVEMDDAEPLVSAHVTTEMKISAAVVHNPAPGAGKAMSGARKPKPRKRDISVTLLHGDAMMLYGDDFEYSIKRTGTSILLMGTYVEGTDPMSTPVMLGTRAAKPRGRVKAG